MLSKLRSVLPLLLASTFAPAQATPEALRALVEHAYEVFQPTGLAVAIVDGGEVVLEAGFGERRVGGGEPILPTTQFNIASCTKAFTAAALGKLVAGGALQWDDLVVDHVPEFRLADPWITSHLTLRDLLCHRSGLKTFAGDLLWYGTDYDDAAVLARLDRLPIMQRFREQFGYQNLMYLVAGLVIERTSGKPWSDYVRDEFFAPLGMTGTATAVAELPASSLPAVPHIDGVPMDVIGFHACKPAAAIWSSVHDMTAWMRMLLADGKWGGSEIVPVDVLHECWSPHTTMRGGRTPAAIEDFSAYGLGWFLYVQDGKKLVEHDGGMPGFISKVTLLPAERFGMVVLNNGMDGVVGIALRRAVLVQRSGGDGRALLDRFGAIAKQRKAAEQAAVAAREAQRVPDTQPSLALADYAGTFEDPVLGGAEIRWDGTDLELVVLPSARILHGKLAHWHHDVFRVDFPDRFLPFALIRFSLDVAGKVEGFRIDCPIDDFDFGALDFRKTAAK